MPNESDKDRSYLVGEKEAVLAELRSKEPDLVDRYLKLSAAIASFDATAAEISAKESQGDPAAEEYRPIRKPLDAVEYFLKKAEAPYPLEGIAKAIEDGGWSKGAVEDPYWNIIYAVRHHLYKSPKLVKRFKLIDGMLGLSEWPDHVFTAIQQEKP